MWLLSAVGSAFFAGITAILAKCGIRRTDSDVATALRTVIVLLFAWLMVFVVGSGSQIAAIPPRSRLFLILSGLATGASWLCYYYAIQNGMVSVVAPIDKMSILVTVVFSRLVLKEPLSRRAAAGLCLMLAGTLVIAAV